MAVETLENLVLLEAEKTETGFQLSFLDDAKSEVREVRLTTHDYDADKQKWKHNPEKEKEVHEFIKEFFGVEPTEDALNKLVDNEYTVYAYDNFNSLVFIDIPDKYTLDDVGIRFDTTITEVVDTGSKVEIKYEQPVKDGEPLKRVSNKSYSKYNEKLKRSLVDPIKRDRVFANIKKDYGVEMDELDKLEGFPIFVVVNSMKNGKGEFPFGEIQAINKKERDEFLATKK